MILLTLEFLGNSQTFLGVLIALLALMLYKHDGNLFHKILCIINEENNDGIEEVRKEVAINELSQDPYYRMIENGAKNGAPSIKKACAIKLLDVNLNMNNKLLAFQPTPYIEYTKKAVDWKEVFLAPMYIFAFCIGLFVIDEVLRIDSGFAFKSFQMIFWFMLISTIFWSCIWIRYVYDAWTIRKKIERSATDTILTKEFIFWILFLIILLVALTVLGLYHKFSPFIDIAILTIISLICIIKGYFASKLLLGHACSTELMKYQFILKHFLWISLGAVFCVFLSGLFTESSFHYQEWLFSFDASKKAWNFLTLKLMAFAIIIVLGLLIPFAVPYFIIFHLRRFAKKQGQKIKTRNNKVVSSMKMDFEQFAIKLGLTDR